MQQYAYLTALAYVFLGELVAFSVCQLLLMRKSNRVHIALWVMASVFSALGTAFAPHLLTVVSVKNFSIWSGAAALAGGIFRYFAVTYRRKSFHRDRWSRFFFWATIIGVPFATSEALAPFRLLALSLVGASISTACYFGMLRNPVWRSRNSVALWIALLGMAISAAVLVARGLSSYPFGPDQFFVGESELQRRAFETLVLISFFLQIGFTGMLVARRDQEDLFADRRAVRATQRARRLATRKQDLARISSERLELIQLLTHEVRQPISNAQASLQSITLNLGSATLMSDRATHALERAQSSLDDITLALSNVIIAATLVSHTRRWDPQQFEAISILEMARLDCHPSAQSRIFLNCSESHIYILGVPILLRVALHNLLDQAIKLSAKGTDIFADVTVDAEQQSVSFNISFCANDTRLREESIFEKRRSSDTSASHLSSLGLFVVKQVAQAHSGEARAFRSENDQLKFTLTLPY